MQRSPGTKGEASLNWPAQVFEFRQRWSCTVKVKHRPMESLWVPMPFMIVLA